VKKLLVGAALAALMSVSAHAATVGVQPFSGPGLADGTWLNGLAGGQNSLYQNGITAAGTTQATATALTPGLYQYEIDTVAASTGVNLPQCIAPFDIEIYNNGANTLTIYPAVANNPLLAAGTQDTINNTTSTTQTTHTMKAYACMKNGIWAAE
jgi:hypothetical protein